MSDVPCNGCTLCCHNDAIRILPHEDASKWETIPHDYMPGARMLAHKPNGNCVYLGESGCTIQSSKPQMCRSMDCRNIAVKYSFTQARKLNAKGALPIAVWTQGRKLIREAK